MIVYVESNYLLELALDQEQAEAARFILELAEANHIALLIPSFAVSEPFSTLVHRRARREERIQEWRQKELVQLQRSQSRRREVESLSSFLDEMRALAAEQIRLLEAAVSRVLAAGRTIDLSPTIFQSARELKREFDLSIQDAMILASVLSDLTVQPHDEPKCFVSTNRKDFDDRDIRGRLRAANCRYIGGFLAARNFLQASLRGGTLDPFPGDEPMGVL